MRRGLLRRLLAAKPILRFLDIHNALTGLIIENTTIELPDGRKKNLMVCGEQSYRRHFEG